LEGPYPEAIDHWSPRLGDGMAAAQRWATLDLQEIRRVFRLQRWVPVAVPSLLFLLLASPVKSIVMNLRFGS
jgi:hypothetical protein